MTRTRHSTRRNNAQKRRDMERVIRRHNQVRENLSYGDGESSPTVAPIMAPVTMMLDQNSPPSYNEVIGVEQDQNGLWRCRYMVLFDRLYGRDRRPLSHFHNDRKVLISCSRSNWCPMKDYTMNAHSSSFIDISPSRRVSRRTPRVRRVLR
ncbi:hypothetical protein RCL_jg24357.t1 [Rhizophagus clarus]|uniref:Uncharacterized protein n=1 Tax=Rhizophagus clarus TaxID=94130 RepID=A0A8H3MHM4_9GLOM|nr:hypothetical protein RCL_jg24357.t1 [Rhizophagus clarus]